MCSPGDFGGSFSAGVVPTAALGYITGMQGEELPGRPSRGADGSEAGGDARREAADDAALVAAVARGDKSAIGGLYDRHAALLLAVGLRILGERSHAEDVLHDVFIEAWHHARDFDPQRGTVRAWLVTRMRSRALDRRATGARQARLADDVRRELGDEPAVSPPAAEAPLDGDRVRGQIKGLGSDLAAVIELAYFEGLTSSQIAERLAIPVGTVKSRMARALSTLREGLADLGGAP